LNGCYDFVISGRVVFDILGNIAVPQQADQIIEYLRRHLEESEEKRDARGAIPNLVHI
jgi:hypothetical protein